MTEIGFVGLGAMGAPLARRLLAGNQVTGTNRTRAKAAALIDDGLVWRDTPREVAAAAQVVFSMVTDDDALAAITRGPDGILAGLRPGTTYVEMSTVSPRTSRQLAARVRAAGATMIDAPVSGSVPAAETGALTIMVGGPEKAFLTAAPLLSRLGNRITHVGDNGQGLLLKLAINISLAAQMLAFSEGLLLAERGGIDPELAARVMTGSAIGSPMLQARAPSRSTCPSTRGSMSSSCTRTSTSPSTPPRPRRSRCPRPPQPSTCSAWPGRWATSTATSPASTRCSPRPAGSRKRHDGRKAATRTATQ